MRFRCEVLATFQRHGGTASAFVFLVFLAACTKAKPASYPMGAVLPFGTVEMSVTSTEATTDFARKVLLVHVRMEKLEGESQARVASQSWNQWFKVTDRNGKKYSCHRFLPTDSYYQNYSSPAQRGQKAWGGGDPFSSVPTDWIMHFDVPTDAEGFTLLINNMTFHDGNQPVSIAVPLDR